jgi:putative oxidoreductase
MKNGSLDRLLKTDPDNTALLIQRVVLGAVMLPHGLQKTFGWFGGYAFQATYGYFVDKMHIPAVVAVLVILAESAGALGLIAGFATRVWAFLIGAVMVGAVLTTHVQVGFFMNWGGSLKGEGFEYHLLALALAIPLMIWGGGRWSVDASITGKNSRHT